MYFFRTELDLYLAALNGFKEISMCSNEFLGVDAELKVKPMEIACEGSNLHEKGVLAETHLDIFCSLLHLHLGNLCTALTSLDFVL